MIPWWATLALDLVLGFWLGLLTAGWMQLRRLLRELYRIRTERELSDRYRPRVEVRERPEQRPEA
jgi:hypothetical protein